MAKPIVLPALAMALIASLSLVRADEPAQLARPCLHGRLEQPNQQARREQAVKVAQQINRAESDGPVQIPGAQRRYRPLDQLQNVPPTPRGFRLQFHTDGITYTLSLKDTLDSCQYAIFSDQDQAIYEATPRMGARLVPVETR
jgi:hypothetical protein